MNPQIRFGEDLMSRVSYIMMNPGGEQELITSVREAINELIVELASGADLTTDDIGLLVPHQANLRISEMVARSSSR